MSKRSRRAPFFAGGTHYVARKSFTFAGDDYKPGDVFPRKGVDVDGRRLRQMYECGRVWQVPAGGEAPPPDLKDAPKRSAREATA